MRPYTVLLLRPDYIAEPYGQDTYMAHVFADWPDDAVEAARIKAWNEDHGDDAGTSWDDYHPLLVLEGHHRNPDPTRGHTLEEAQQPAQASQVDVTDAEIVAVMRDGNNCNYNDEAEHIQFARAILALRPAAVPMTPREIELIDGMIEVQLDHAQRCDAISNRDMAEKQKGWDMERVELLRRIRSFGITAQAKKETP